MVTFLKKSTFACVCVCLRVTQPVSIQDLTADLRKLAQKLNGITVTFFSYILHTRTVYIVEGIKYEAWCT